MVILDLRCKPFYPPVSALANPYNGRFIRLQILQTPHTPYICIFKAQREIIFFFFTPTYL